ncbi:MAG: hypothetical protein ACM3ME_05305 [Chloroflexota bacterium]
MKKILTIFVIFILSAGTIKAQEDAFTLPKVYLGLGTGINAYTGLLGVAVNVRVLDKTFIEGGLGLGGWGYKYSFGLRYDFKTERTFGLGINYTGATGLDNLEMDLETIDGTEKKTSLECLSGGTIDLKGRFSFKAGQKNRFYLDLGYAFPLEERYWKVKNGVILSDVSEAALDITQPGGFMIGLGFLFGLANERY